MGHQRLLICPLTHNAFLPAFLAFAHFALAALRNLLRLLADNLRFPLRLPLPTAQKGAADPPVEKRERRWALPIPVCTIRVGQIDKTPRKAAKLC